jgi:hypothetical protein
MWQKAVKKEVQAQALRVRAVVSSYFAARLCHGHPSMMSYMMT